MAAFNNIQYSLKNWYSTHKRDLPWRRTNDPYKIWVSEIMLQQTQVKQGLEYYKRFIKVFPNVKALAKADEQQVLKLWQGLGYYSRARNMQFAARQIVDLYSGGFPKKYEDILSLKGIGAYTAAAVGSIAFNLPHAVLDGNVARVISRLFAVDEAANSSAGKKALNIFATKLLDHNDPGEHNQAIMEFGALHCVPRNPDCSTCPLNKYCMAFSTNKVDQYPLKTKRIKQRNRYFLYLVFKTDQHTWIKERTEKDIWKGMYEFPMIEFQEPIKDEQIMESISSLDEKKRPANTRIEMIQETFRHILTHQIIHARFVILHREAPPNLNAKKINLAGISEYPVSRLIDRFLESFSF